MCLAIPGKVIEAFDQGGMRMARVQFGGIIREACLEYVPDTRVGEYVLVHVGFAISKVDEEEAHRTYQILEDMDQLSELMAPVVDERDRHSQTPHPTTAAENGATPPANGVTRGKEGD
ncbi:MAG TPA: HypC/HybG/HupF family hydrogenase formation chaperone [Acidobacteriaceae bacterium]|nr:HypC/HybG/HupF family hydrogenase formation chaperone [Acidobacteriaceae bacterium]